MILDKFDIKILRTFHENYYINYHQIHSHAISKIDLPINIINERIRKFVKYEYISLDPNDIYKGKLTPSGNIFLIWQLKARLMLRHCYNNKWERFNHIFQHFDKKEPIIKYLCDEKLIKMLGRGFAISLREYVTTEKGDIFVFDNIKDITNPISKLWKLKYVKGEFDFSL